MFIPVFQKLTSRRLVIGSFPGSCCYLVIKIKKGLWPEKLSVLRILSTYSKILIGKITNTEFDIKKYCLQLDHFWCLILQLWVFPISTLTNFWEQIADTFLKFLLMIFFNVCLNLDNYTSEKQHALLDSNNSHNSVLRAGHGRFSSKKGFNGREFALGRNFTF